MPMHIAQQTCEEGWPDKIERHVPELTSESRWPPGGRRPRAAEGRVHGSPAAAAPTAPPAAP